MYLSLLTLILFLTFSCSPTVKVQAPDKPVEINLNIKIEHNITVKVDKQLDDIMKKNDDIF